MPVIDAMNTRVITLAVLIVFSGCCHTRRVVVINSFTLRSAIESGQKVAVKGILQYPGMHGPYIRGSDFIVQFSRNSSVYWDDRAWVTSFGGAEIIVYGRLHSCDVTAPKYLCIDIDSPDTRIIRCR